MRRGIHFLLLLGLIFISQVNMISQSSVLDSLPEHGFGFLERIRNETEFSISVAYDKHPTHDAIPEGTVVRIKSLDTRHGSEGKYYTLKKVDKAFFFQADGTDPKDPATLFTVSHRLASNLKSWLGFSHATANNNIMRFDPETKTIVFDKKEFLAEDAHASHWEIVGSTIDECYLKNRLSEGVLFNYRGKVEFKLEPDQESVSTENAMWGISFQTIRDLQARLTHHQNLLAPAAGNLAARSIERAKNDNWTRTWDTRNRVKRQEQEARDHLNNVNNIIQQTQQELDALNKGGANVFKYTGSNWQQVPGLLNFVSVRNDNDVWGTNSSGALFHWDGKNNWTHINTQVPMRNVAVSAAGQVWCISTDLKPWIKTETGFTPGPTEGLHGEKMVLVAPRNDKEVWAIAADWNLYIYTGSDWKKNTPPNTSISYASVSDSGEVWAVDNKGMVWKNKDLKKWEAVNCPAPLQSIAVRNKNDVWGTSKSYDIFHWDGKKWTQVPGKLDFIAVASGVTITKIPGKTAVKELETASTVLPDGKPNNTNPAARIKFEIVKLGMGGGIPPQSAGDYVKIPVTKNPKVFGFAKDVIDNFDVSTLLKVSPLLTRGTAWLETALKTPGRTSVSFLARPKDQGDIQVVFGQAVSDSYVWRVIIGGWKNTKAAIVKRRYEGGTAIDDIVCEITKEQNPLAAAIPGNFTPYWVSIDNGLILVGMGELGENIFLAWRDPNPPDDVNQVGFGSYKQPLEYTQIQLGNPVVAQKPQRIYFPTQSTKSKPISVPPAKDSFVWSPYPFRTSDNGSICFEIQGKDQAVIALSKDPQNGTDHYALIFGATDNKDKKGLALKRWIADTKQYKDLYFLKEEAYPAITLNPTKFKKFWLSFNHGQIILGQGSFGQNILFICQDLGPLDSIDAIGFGAFGSTAVQVKNIQIAPPILTNTEKKAEGYSRAKETVAFKGSIIIILPFEYKFSQEGQSVKLDDLVNNKSFYPGATPQQGALYSFMFTLLPNGAPKMDWTKAPSNPQELKLQRELVKLDATADLQQAQAEAIRKAGAIDKSMKEAEAAKTMANIETAKTVTETAAKAGAGLAAAGPIGAAVGIGISTASTIAFGVTAGILGSQAAQQQFKGAELEAQAHRKALDKEADAAQTAFQKKLLQGEANFAFRGHDSYVYVDQPERPQLGSASIPPEAMENKKELLELLTQADAINPMDDKEKFQTLLTTCQNMLFKINHFYVISENEVKQRIFKNLDKLFKASKQNESGCADLVSVFFSAYNNSFLVNDIAPDEAVIKANWLRNINLLAGNFLKQPEFEISGYFGEYIWPLKLPEPGSGTVTFEATGTNDLFIGFTNDLRQQKTRNTDKEMYEVVIGGWDNNKSAIRIKSLGKSVKERTFEENEAATLNPNEAEKYWIALNNGHISVGRGTPGENMFLSWKDPYPIQRLRYVGISSWNAPITIKNLQVSAGIAIKEAPKSQRVRKITRVPIGTAKSIPSDSAEIAMLEKEELEMEQEPEEKTEEASTAEKLSEDQMAQDNTANKEETEDAPQSTDAKEEAVAEAQAPEAELANVVEVAAD